MNNLEPRQQWGRTLGVLGLMVVFLVPGGVVLAQQANVTETGEQLFLDKCAVCHGESATGDGALAADLNPKPADLTRISERNEGSFPRKKIFAKIWGRDDEIVNTHIMSEMPAFYVAPVMGNDEEFEKSAGRLSPKHINQIISFLTTIQKQ
jgi:mono/diheme cytochrome c family protein